MSKKQEALELIKRIKNKESFLTYKQAAEVLGYHEKYLLKLKKEYEEGTFKVEHGNKNRKPKNTITEEEKQYIINLYKRSNASIRQFCRFYKKRSYSCIWHVLKDEGLI